MENKKSLTWVITILGIVLIIGIVGHYLWFMHDVKITVDKGNLDNMLQVLIGFYSSLFTAIAVIIGIIAIIGWGWIKELKEKLEVFEKVENKVNFLNKKEELAEWAKDKVDILGLNTFELKSLNKDDKEKLKEIKDYVINDLTNCGWLELFLAHQFMTEEKKFDKAESILKFIESRDLLDDKSKIHSFIYHILGQLYWEKYYSQKKDKNFNYFKSKKDKLKSPTADETDSAIKLLEESRKNYEKSIEYIEKRKGQTIDEYDDRSYANNAVVLLELYKFYPVKGDIEKNKCIEEAKKNLDKIKKKNYSYFYDLARVHFYKEEDEEFSECLNDFKENLDLYEGKERYKLKEKHNEYMKEEKNELDGEGFPGKDFNIQEFFASKAPLTKRIWSSQKRKKSS